MPQLYIEQRHKPPKFLLFPHFDIFKQVADFYASGQI